MFFGSFRYLAITLCLVIASGSILETVEGSTEMYWLERESAARGNLTMMLGELEKADAIPHLRLNRSSEELADILSASGRFRELGLTDEEGKILVDAVYEKMGIDRRNRSEVISSEVEIEAERSAVPPYRAGMEFEELGAVLTRWPFDWASQRDEWAAMVEGMHGTGVLCYLWVNSASQRDEAIAYMNGLGVPMDHVRWVVERTNSVWLRDFGPQFIYEIGGSRWGIVDFHYYDSRPEDDDTPEFIANVMGVPMVDRQNSNVVYTEGGNLNHDGLGSVTYSQRTYNNNPGVDPSVIDQRIMSAFLATQNIVLEDPTLDMTGHVDMWQKIVSSDTVLVARYDPDETDYQILEDTATQYENSTNGAGDPWNVIRIRQPDVYYIFFVIPVVRTYTNSLIVNDVVLLCTFGIPDDQQAINVYEQVFPNKTIIPIDASVIIESGGAWHCVTMEYPNPNNPD